MRRRGTASSRTLALIIALGVAGFVFWPMFAVAGYLAWRLLKGGEGQGRKVSGLPDHRTVGADHPRWRAAWLSACESPAESEFLEAMIRVCRLKPDRGVLGSPEMKLRMQVPIGRYRADFVVDGWLVVEIDGAAYHSSREAVARDRERDRYMAGLGLTVLRIPARTVFRTPVIAVRRVRAAHGQGRRRR